MSKFIFIKILLPAMSLVILFAAGCGSSGAKETPAPVSYIPAVRTETLDETVLCEDHHGMTITAKSLVAGDAYGPAICLEIENKNERPVTVSCVNSSVNGYMLHNRMSVEVAPEETAEGYLEFSGMELEDAGISEIADFEFQLYLWNASRSDMGPEGTETPVIQLRTSAAEGFSYSFDDSGEEVYHLNWIRIVSQGVSAVNNGVNPALKFFIENRWKKAIWIRAKEVSVKGYKVDSDSLENRMIAPGKRAIYYVPLKENFLMKSSAGKIESAQLSFHIFKWILFPDQSDTPLINLEY